MRAQSFKRYIYPSHLNSTVFSDVTEIATPESPQEIDVVVNYGPPANFKLLVTVVSCAAVEAFEGNG